MALTTWLWSLRTVARSYRTVVALAALIALWCYGAYEWLAVPESSALLLVLTVLWGFVQLAVAVMVVTGLALGVSAAAAAGDGAVPLRALITTRGGKIQNVVTFSVVAAVVVWLCCSIFNWFNGHSLEAASFLTFHSQRAISHVPVEEIYQYVEGLLWTVVFGFLLSYLLALVTSGWGGARKGSGRLVVGCAFGAPFLSSLLSVMVFGGVAGTLMKWHPAVPPGFWDYTQAITRFALALLLIAAGVLFWLLALARQQRPPGDATIDTVTSQQ